MAVAGPIPGVYARMERRFITASLIPVTLLLAAYVTTWLLIDRTPAEIARSWSSISPANQVLVALGFVGISWFLSAMVSSNWRKIVRLYEGYPIKRWHDRHVARNEPGVSRETWLGLPGVRWHLRKQQVASPAEIYRRYPPRKYSDNTLPTSLGNILLSGELYALERYGLDLNLMWPRLYWQLPTDVRASIDSFKEEHQIPLALSFVSALFGVLAGMTVLLRGGTWELFAATTGGAFVISSLAYLLALERAEEYAEQLRTIADLYRRRLPEEWQTGPRRYSSDEEYFAAARVFIQTGIELPAGRKKEAAKSVASSSPPTTAPKALGSIRRSMLRAGKCIAAPALNRRLLHLVVLATAIWIVMGSLVLASVVAPAEAATDRRLVLPVEPSLSAEQAPVEGQVVDGVIRPCGTLLEGVRVLAFTQDGSTRANVTLGLDYERVLSLEGCAPDSVTILVRE